MSLSQINNIGNNSYPGKKKNSKLNERMNTNRTPEFFISDSIGDINKQFSDDYHDVSCLFFANRFTYLGE